MTTGDASTPDGAIPPGAQHGQFASQDINQQNTAAALRNSGSFMQLRLLPAQRGDTYTLVCTYPLALTFAL
jgi:hypothetical protein